MSAIDPRKLLIRFITALLLGPACLYITWLGGLPFYILTGLCLVLVLYEALQLARNIQPFMISIMLIGAYCIACFAGFAYIGAQNSVYAVAFIILVASSDVGAYFFGKYFGGAKLLPAVSPNKTWAGLIGACSFPLVFALAWLSPFEMELNSLFVHSALIAIFIGISGQCGDLLISSIKRMAAVKDAGSLLPGHGGLLDRFDGLMFASLLYALYLVFV